MAETPITGFTNEITYRGTLKTATRANAGAYWLGGVNYGIGYYLEHKPSHWHRWWMRVMLGRVWADTP